MEKDHPLPEIATRALAMTILEGFGGFSLRCTHPVDFIAMTTRGERDIIEWIHFVNKGVYIRLA